MLPASLKECGLRVRWDDEAKILWLRLRHDEADACGIHAGLCFLSRHSSNLGPASNLDGHFLVQCWTCASSDSKAVMAIMHLTALRVQGHTTP